MTSSAITGGTYYVLRSRLMPGLYKPGIANHFERRLQQHGGPERWETVATFRLGRLIARDFEQRMLRRFSHCRVNAGGEYLRLADHELAELLALAEQEQACADAIRARLAAERGAPTTPHAQRQIEHAARLAELGHDAMPPPPTATTAAAAVFMGVPVPPAPSTMRGWRDWSKPAIGAAGLIAFLATAAGGPSVAVQIYAWAAMALIGPPVLAVALALLGQLAWNLLKAAARVVRP